jgi:uncharacterized protein (DUF924 family)
MSGAGYTSVIEFWFGTAADDAAVARERKNLWWSKDPALDAQIRDRYGALVEAAADSAHAGWAETPRGRLALILLFDQFPRNMHRGTARAFAFDPLAQRLAVDGLESGADQALRPIERVFFYLPLEHAESLDLQERCVELFYRLAAAVPDHLHELFRGYVQYAERHRDIIARFGRFPHRNAALGRASTPEETEFLKQPGSAF